MCPDRLTVTHLILRGLEGQFERAVPGRGCELLEAVAVVGNAALLAGFAAGLFTAYFGRDLVLYVIRRRGGRNAA